METGAATNLEECARRLLDDEVASGKSPDAKVFSAFRVCEKLRGPLGKLLGLGGFRALLSRALALEGVEFPWLRTLYINPDSTVAGLEGLKLELDSSSVTEGELALTAQLLRLLVTFIGPALTLGLIAEVWPNVVLDDLNFGNEELP